MRVEGSVPVSGAFHVTWRRPPGLSISSSLMDSASRLVARADEREDQPRAAGGDRPGADQDAVGGELVLQTERGRLGGRLLLFDPSVHPGSRSGSHPGPD